MKIAYWIVALGLAAGCDGTLLRGGGNDRDTLGAKDCSWLLDRCNRGQAHFCERYRSQCASADASPAPVEADAGAPSDPDAGSVSDPDTGSTSVADSGSTTSFTTEGEENPAIAWDGIASSSDSNDGIHAWGRLASCSRVGEPTNCSGIDRLSVVDLGGSVGKVYQAAMKSGDDYRGKARAEFAKPQRDDGSSFYIYHGDEYYIGFRSKLSVGFDSKGNGDSNSGNIMQLKGKLSCGGPALGLTIKKGHLTLRRETGDSSDVDIDAALLGNRDGIFWNGPLVSSLEGKWFNIVLHVKFNIDPKIGFVEIWLDGVKQQNNGKTKIYGKTMCFDASDERVELKLGIYRSDRYNKSSFDYHWIRDPRIGKSYAAVTPRTP